MKQRPSLKIILLTFLFIIIFTIISLALDDKSITSIVIERKYETLINTINPNELKLMAAGKIHYEIDISPDFQSKDLKIGEYLSFKIKVTANDGYNFRGLKEASCTINCGVITNLILSEDRREAVFDLTMNPLPVELEAPANLRWDRNIAYWDPVVYSSHYEIKLYTITNQGKLSNTIKTLRTFDNNIDLENYIFEKPGDYIFSVTALPDDETIYLNKSKQSTLSFEESNMITQEQLGITGGTWKLDKNGNLSYKYQKEYITNSKLIVHGYYYFFDDIGYAKKGWIELDSDWFYFHDDYHMAKGWLSLENKTYYLNDEGSMITGWKDINDNSFFFNSDGEMAIGWNVIDDKIYYLSNNGVKQTTKLMDQVGNVYVLNDDGSLKAYIKHE